MYKNSTEKFVDTFDKKKHIIQSYGIHISAMRNFAQLASKSLFGDTLYLPINNVYTNNATINNTTEVSGNVKINNNFKISNINNLNINYNLRFIIVPWGGDPSILPKNWFLCDGSKYIYKNPNEPSKYDITNDNNFIDTLITVPDMRDKFILCVNDQTYTTEQNIFNNVPLRNHSFKSTGGTEKELLTSNNIPLHHHYFNLTTVNENITYNKQLINTKNIKNILNKSGNHQIITTDNNDNVSLLQIGVPQNNIDIKGKIYNIINTLESADGSGSDLNNIIWDNNIGNFKYNQKIEPHENMTPYYKLCYIIKL